MSAPVEIIPIGGLGQFGMNCTLVRSENDAILVDVGLGFSTLDALGVDAIVPDIGSLLDASLQISGIFLTHGHDDHIGGLPEAMEVTQCPVYGSDLTLGLVRDKLREIGVPEAGRLKAVAGRQRTRAGAFTVEFIDVTHSIPGAFALAIETAAGLIVHTADFKLDPTPVMGPTTDLDRLEALGRDGVRLLLLDSTNARQEGTTPSERSVAGPFARLLEAELGRVFVTTFASHIARVQLLADAAAGSGRRVCISGRRAAAAVEIARGCGHLRFPAGLIVAERDVMSLSPRKSLVIAGGSQGEPGSAMSRIARGEAGEIGIADGDTVVHSARAIPGNELAIARMFDDIALRGARVLSGSACGLHVSGHAAREDLARMLDAVLPEALVPVHGTHLHLLACASLARSRPRPPRTILTASNGDIIRLDDSGARIAGRARTAVSFLDRERGRIGVKEIEERRRMALHGLLVPTVVRERASGRPVAEPRVVSRGMAVPRGGDYLAQATTIATEAAASAAADPALAAESGAGVPTATAQDLERRLEDDLGRLARRRTGKRPLVAPVVIDV